MSEVIVSIQLSFEEICQDNLVPVSHSFFLFPSLSLPAFPNLSQREGKLEMTV